jgi:hypothetical protein
MAGVGIWGCGLDRAGSGWGQVAGGGMWGCGLDQAGSG